MIPYGRQDITQADIERVVEVLKSDFLTQGPMVPRFEEAVAQHVGSKHALAVSSATAALHIACLSLGLRSGDRLWTSPISFVASANCGLYCGATVDFVDIDPVTYNMCPQALERKLIEAERANKLPKIVIPVHLSGLPCDMAAIYELSQKYGFKIIEDASHAIGGRYRDGFIGNGKYSDITVFSFHPVKIITTAEGGMALTNSAQLAKKMALLRSHGITRNETEMTHSADGPWYYQQIDLGFNYRMTELQAALGISQMTRLDSYVARRHAIADRYDERLSDLPVVVPSRAENSYSALHLYIIRVIKSTSNSSPNHLEVFECMRAQGIAVNLHYIPIHTQPYYKQMGFSIGDFPESERYYSEAISLPIYATLSESEQDIVIAALAKALRK